MILEGAMAQVTEIVDGIYRICSLRAGQSAPVGFNQFLIDDEHPTLIHTGYHDSYDAVRSAVGEVLDPKRLSYVVLAHFESDECGGMDRFLADAPSSVLVASELGATVNLAHWGSRGPVKGMCDGDVLDLGRHRLKFLETPHVHHWDSMMVLEEATCSLFPADLFIQPGDQPPIVTEDLAPQMLALYRKIGIFAHEAPVRQTVNRIEKINPASRCTAAASSARLHRASSVPSVRSRSLTKECCADVSCQSKRVPAWLDARA
jgi:flavorubredoxin